MNPLLLILQQLDLYFDEINEIKPENPAADTLTYNGNPSFSTIGTPHLDFYAGVTRQTPEERIKELAEQCTNSDLRLATITFFQKRNCRGGAGERKPFLLALGSLPEKLREALYSLVPSYGYWDDLNSAAKLYPTNQRYIAKMFAAQLLANMLSLTSSKCKVDRNLEKWLPTEGGSDDQKWKAVNLILEEFNKLIPSKTKILLRVPALRALNSWLTALIQEQTPELPGLESKVQDGRFVICLNGKMVLPLPNSTLALLPKFQHLLEKVQKLPDFITRLTSSGYRKWLVHRRAQDGVIEHFKSTNDWKLIDYSKVPSIAFDRTKKQFLAHDQERFQEFTKKVEKGESKINVGRLMPFELVKQESSEVRDQQWKLLVEETKTFYSGISEESVFHPKNSISVADVSGSMTSCHSTKGFAPIDVSKSLAILMAEVGQRSIYTFSGKPKKYDPTWTNLTEALKILQDHNYNTNFKALIDRIFDDCMLEADRLNIPPSSAFPGSIIVYTDGGFDSMVREKPTTAADYIREKFGKFQKVPIFVFWNVAGNSSDFAVQKTTPGIVQLAGFSKDLYQLFTRLTNVDELTPDFFFRSDVLSEQYQPVLKVFDKWSELAH